MSRIISESITDKVYHFTTVDNLYSILKNNRLILSSIYKYEAEEKDNPRGYYYFSLSRTKSAKLGYPLSFGFHRTGNFCRIEFDGRKLKYKYPGKPFDYYMTKSLKDKLSKTDNYAEKMDIYQKVLKYFEYEDRIFNNQPYINDIIKYINKISIMLPTDEPYEEFFENNPAALNQLKIISDICKENGVELNIYDDIDDFSNEKINNKVFIDFSMGEDKFNNDSSKKQKGLDKYFFMILTSFILLDKKNDVNLDRYILNYYNKINLNDINDSGVLIKDIKEMMEDIMYDKYKYTRNLKFEINHIIETDSLNNDSVFLLNILTRDLRKYKTTNLDNYVDIKLKNIEP
jgi:hypothetical protein